jgi:ADP-heptose:LPS heptosyltransferase
MKSVPIASTVRRVLIYRLGSLGDTVVALPCFHLIARTYPNAERCLLTNFPVHAKAPAAAAVLGDSDLVHGYMSYMVGTRKIGELLRLARQIRRFSPDVLVYLMPLRPQKNVRRDRIFFRLAGVRRIVGLGAEAELKHRFSDASGRFEAEAFRLARAVSLLGDAQPGDLANWSLDLTSGERDAADAALGPLKDKRLIVCGPGTKMQAKDWGQDNWRALLTRLNKEYPEHGLALVGAREDFGVADYAAQDWSGPKVNLCGKLTPRETAALLEHADVFLGPDSGPMHLAGSVGTTCVIAFSAAGRPGVWFPVGSQHEVIYHQTSCHGCQLETCIAEARRCLTSISVAEMAEAVDRVLGRRAGETF